MTFRKISSRYLFGAKKNLFYISESIMAKNDSLWLKNALSLEYSFSSEQKSRKNAIFYGSYVIICSP